MEEMRGRPARTASRMKVRELVLWRCCGLLYRVSCVVSVCLSVCLGRYHRSGEKGAKRKRRKRDRIELTLTRSSLIPLIS